jgi:hypothetical protein
VTGVTTNQSADIGKKAPVQHRCHDPAEMKLVSFISVIGVSADQYPPRHTKHYDADLLQSGPGCSESSRQLKIETSISRAHGIPINNAALTSIIATAIAKNMTNKPPNNDSSAHLGPCCSFVTTGS